jgi:hypothetical protein
MTDAIPDDFAQRAREFADRTEGVAPPRPVVHPHDAEHLVVLKEEHRHTKHDLQRAAEQLRGHRLRMAIRAAGRQLWRYERIADHGVTTPSVTEALAFRNMLRRVEVTPGVVANELLRVQRVLAERMMPPKRVTAKPVVFGTRFRTDV